MKTLTLSALLCAMMALTTAAALPRAENDPGTEETEVLPGAEDGNWTDELIPPGGSHAVKRSVSCPWGWTNINGRCFRYVPRSMTWARAERNCLSMGGHLASVHSSNEYHEIQSLIAKSTHGYSETWIGGSDAEEEHYWFWSDGTQFSFSRWCRGEPNNYFGHQNCILMNATGDKCWDDLWCDHHHPSVCVRKS